MADYRPLIPPYNHDIPIFTFEDAVDQILDAFNLNRSGKHLRFAKRAVLDAYRDLPQRHKWPFFERRGQVTTIAPSSTGTVVYDHTGGASERLVTLSGSTWPVSDLTGYGIKIGTIQYEIEEWKSTTTLTLGKNRNPGADVASSAYSLYKEWYPLPTDFRRGSMILDLSGGSADPYHTSRPGTLDALYAYSSPGQPLRYTITGDGHYYGGMGLLFAPPPSVAEVYDFIYAAVPRPLRHEKYSAGTVSLTTLTVTGSETAFDSTMVGSVIRFPYAARKDDEPTGIAGNSNDNDNPYAAERVITAVASATSLTIDLAVSETISGSAYTISDPIDFERTAMMTAFLRFAEYYYAIYAGKEGERGYRYGIFKDQLLYAMENSARFRDIGLPPGDEGANYTVTINTDSA